MENVYWHEFVVRAQGGCSYVFYTIEGDSRLYLYEEAAYGSYATDTLYCLNQERGTISETIVLQKTIDNNENATYTYLGQTISEEEYHRQLKEYKENSQKLMMYKNNKNFENFEIFQNMKAQAMILDEAYEILRGNESNEQEEISARPDISSYDGQWECYNEYGEQRVEMELSVLDEKNIEVDIGVIRLRHVETVATLEKDGVYRFHQMEVASGEIELCDNQRIKIRFDDTTPFVEGEEFILERG